MDKKGVLGLSLAKAVFLIFIVLVVLGVAGILVGVSLRTVTDDIDTTSGSISNETLTTVTEHGETATIGSRRNPSCTVIQAYNATSGTLITANNYTFTSGNCTIYFGVGNSNGINNSDWNLSYTYQYSTASTSDIVLNTSQAYTNFFTNTDTILAIIIVVVIIAAIGIVILIISAFGGAGAGKIGGKLSRKSSSAGADTVMGI